METDRSFHNQCNFEENNHYFGWGDCQFLVDM